MTQEPSENITEGFKTLCRIPKRKQNKQKKERKNGEKTPNDIVEVTTETTTTKEVYLLHNSLVQNKSERSGKACVVSNKVVLKTHFYLL